jgi:hypothetical protein
MTDIPRLTPAKQQDQAARAVRLGKALRDNLHRRKQQAREREAAEHSAPAGETMGAAPTARDRDPPA